MDEGVLPFIGRARECAVFTRQLDEVIAGRAHFMGIEGEAGIGKTRLLEEVASIARARGVEVVWGRCPEDAGAPPLWPWLQVLQTLVETEAGRATLAGLGPLAAPLATLMPETPTPRWTAALPMELDRRALHEAVLAFLSAFTAQQPLLLIIDDSHWADPASVALLDAVIQGLSPARLLVAAAWRDESVIAGSPLASVLAMTARLATAIRLSLTGLSVAEIEALVKDRRAGPQHSSPHALAERLHARTEGNPFFVQELLRLGEFSGPPPAVRDVLRRRLDRLTSNCRQVLTFAAVAGRDMDLDVLTAATDISEDGMLDALDEAEAARLLLPVAGAPGRYRFSHALVRETLYDSLTAGRRMRIHRRIAAILESRPGAPTVERLAALAYHFHESAEIGNQAKAAGYAHLAGRAALAATAYEDAERRFETGLAMLDQAGIDDASLRFELLLGRAEARRLGGLAGVQDAHVAAAEVARKGGPRALARLALSYGDAWPDLYVPDPLMISLLEETVAAGSILEPAMLARLYASLTFAARLSYSAERLDQLSRDGLDLARQSGDVAALGAALHGRYTFYFTLSRALEERIELALELVALGERHAVTIFQSNGHLWALWGYIIAGRMDEARLHGEAYKRLAGRLRQAASDIWVAVQRGYWLLLAGDWPAASNAIADLVAVGTRHHQPVVGMFAAAQQFVIAKELGGLAAVVEPFRIAAAAMPRAIIYRCVVAFVLWHMDRRAEAVGEFRQLVDHDLAVSVREENWTAALALLAELCADIGDAERAALLYDLLLPFEGQMVTTSAVYFRGAVSQYLGRLAMTVEHWDTAAQHFAAALALTERAGARPWSAWTEYDQALLWLRRVRAANSSTVAQDEAQHQRWLDQAGVHLRAAQTVAEELGMVVLFARLQDLAFELTSIRLPLSDALPVGALNTEPEGPVISAAVAVPAVGLTTRELEVLALVAAGHSNREIAEQLVLSTFTVDRHLVNTYRKINARGRADAVAWAFRHGLGPHV